MISEKINSENFDALLQKWHDRDCKELKACQPPCFVMEKEAWKLKGPLGTTAVGWLLMGLFISYVTWQELQRKLYYFAETGSCSASVHCSVQYSLFAAKLSLKRLKVQVLIWQTEEDISVSLPHDTTVSKILPFSCQWVDLDETKANLSMSNQNVYATSKRLALLQASV